MSAVPSMPLFVNDMMGETATLTMEQYGAYQHILNVTWANGGRALPDDDTLLARTCRMTAAKFRARIRPAIARFFDLSGGTWRSAWLEQQWAYVQKSIAAKRANGAKGGRPRHDSPPPDPTDSASKSCSQNDSHAEHFSEQFRAANPLKPNGSAKATGFVSLNLNHNLNKSTHPHPSFPDGKDLIEEDAGAREAVQVVGERVAAMAGMPADAGRSCARIAAWLEEGADPERDIYPAVADVMSRTKQVCIRSFRYFDQAVANAHAERTAPLPEGKSNVQHLRVARSEKRNGAAAYLDRLLAESRGNAG